VRSIILTILICAAAALAFAQRETHPAGVITGRVVDDEGRPMKGIEVQALAIRYSYAGREFLPRGNKASTNDRGEFRLFWLEPGSYYVFANPTPEPDPQAQPRPSKLGYLPSEPDTTFVATYFPGSENIKEADVVAVAPGDIDIHAFQLATLPLRVIRFRLSHPKLSEANTVYPLITIRSMTDPSPRPTPSPRPLGNGEFEIRTGLGPGIYQVVLTALTRDGTYTGSVSLNVDRTDPAPIEIPVSRTISLEGQVRVEMEGQLPPLSIRFVPDPRNAVTISAFAEVYANGRFVLKNLLPGMYSITVDGLPDEAYGASAKLHDEDTSPNDVEFADSDDSGKLTLAVKTGGTIAGVVVDETRSANSGAVVVLLPPPALRTRRDLYRFATTNNQGEFLLQGIVPGDYTVVAVPPVELEKPSAVAFHTGLAITVASRSHTNVGAIAISNR